MRKLVYVAGIGCLVICAVSALELRQHRLFAQLPTPGYGESEAKSASLIALSSEGAQNRQQVTVIDPQSRVMSVYHIDHASGMISLKSVRNIRADLLMDEYNTESPLPREIRAILTQR